MARRYSSVSEMAKHLTDDKDFQTQLDKEIAGKSMAKTLFVLRCSHGVTQKEMAERLGFTQSRISKLENAPIDAIKVSDLVAYAKALDLNLSIAFHQGQTKNTTSVDCVRFHTLQIKKHLDNLAKLAHKDDDIFAGVVKFYSETLVNFLQLFSRSAAKLPKKPADEQSTLDICMPAEMCSVGDVLD
ncbi:MAG: helix-turn-helix transcriptional regulator [bacterium]|nr:helix-turn-helix transcriptional regulator [bacterium]